MECLVRDVDNSRTGLDSGWSAAKSPICRKDWSLRVVLNVCRCRSQGCGRCRACLAVYIVATGRVSPRRGGRQAARSVVQCETAQGGGWCLSSVCRGAYLISQDRDGRADRLLEV